MTVEPAAATWSAYWEGMGHRHIFVVEARDHVARLRREVAPRPTDRVLDFGCGFGHVVELLAPSVAGVGFWDAAAGMRRATAERTASLGTVGPVDLGGPVPESALGSFDLVLANSVVQYMTADELAGWMPRWRSLLVPEGRIVLSDIPVPGASAAVEILGMLRFAARHGFLLRAVRDGVREARRYSRSRGSADLRRWRPEDLVRSAAAHGLHAQVLPANLTHRSGRFSVVLTPA
ncbi:MAG: class I SAM-dependent methyltransferase [Pseudonocardia sp.]|nr:class I SAM-dependent methyltransferase [Pseudonocardia sp.]